MRSRAAKSAPLLCFAMALLLGTGCTIDFDSAFAEPPWGHSGADAAPDAVHDTLSEDKASLPDSPVDAPLDHAKSDSADAPLESAGEIAPGSCSDGKKNGTESDVDCGGTCAKCVNGKTCNGSSDCSSSACVDGVCCDQECKGTCMACTAAKTGGSQGACASVVAGTDPDSECVGGHQCTSTGCESCLDGVKNGDETGVDCGGSCQPCGAENCVNGVDDDSNGLVDCEDPACSAFQCVEPAPLTWQGPGLLGINDQAPSCPMEWPNGQSAGTGNPTGQQASCSPCACTPSQVSVCVPPTLQLWDPGNCGSAPSQTESGFSVGICKSFVDTMQFDSARAMLPTVSGGACAASGGVLSAPTPTWSQQARVCSGAPAGQGCSGSKSACVPKPPTTFLPQSCIWKSGAETCPASFPNKVMLYSSISDTRQCSACQCSSPIGGTCQGTFAVYGSPDCSGPVNPVPADGTSCAPLNQGNLFESAIFNVTSILEGMCPISGGSLIGTVAGEGPITVCCAP